MSDQEVVEEGEGSTDSLISHDDEGNCFTNLIRRDRCVQVSLVLFHALLCLANLVLLGLTSTFDSLCAVKKGKSVVNCTEKVLIHKPQHFVIAYYLTSITYAICFFTTLYLKPACVKFWGFKDALKELIRKGSFWSFNIMYMFFIVDYITMVFKKLPIESRLLAAMVIPFCASKLIVAYFFNYVLPVKFPAVNERKLTRVYIWVAYWATLVLFFLATAHYTLAITLDLAEKLSPLGKVQIGSHNFATVCRLLLLGIKATFEGRLFLFYWNKIFHGDKDLFSTFVVLRSIQEQPISSIRVNDDQDDIS